MASKAQGSSVKKNFAYNIAYQVLAIVLPFITAPYLSRVLGAEGLGIYSYSYSIASYFLLFATLGMANHGNRTIAATPRDRESLGEAFANNYAIQLFCGVATFVVYMGYCLVLQENQLVALIQGFVVLSGLLDISWLYFGLEEFKLTVTRNAVCKVLSVVAIFLFVRTTDDLWVYALIMSLAVFVSQAVMWGFLRSRVAFVRPSWAKVRKNIKPVLVMFVPVLSYSIYMLIDKVQIGQLADMVNVGYYSNAEKIMNIPVCATTALSTVMLPRATKVLAEGNDEGHMHYLVVSFSFVAIVIGFLCFGISSVSRLFCPLYFGDEFVVTGEILEVLIFAPLISGAANVIRTQYLIPKHMDRVYVVSTIAAAVVNFVLNLILIPVLQAKGAVIGTLAAETSVLLIQALSVRRELPWGRIASASLPYLGVSLGAFVLVWILNLTLSLGPLVQMCVDIAVGGVFYVVLVLVVARSKRDYVWGLLSARIPMLRGKGI